MDTRLEQIATEIREEFCKRVIPSDIVRYLQCLTTQDIEKVQAEEKQNGAIQAAEILLQRLVRRCDWLHELVKALPDVGLEDFGERLEQKTRQLPVNIDSLDTRPQHCTDGHNCGEETSLKLLSKDLEEVSISPEPLTSKPAVESTEEMRKRVKLKVIDKMLNSVQTASDLPEVMALAEQMCTQIDNIINKCIIMMFRMETEEKIEAFWQLYETGGLAAALSRDILTPKRRQQMIEDARNEGVELQDSDFNLQVIIKESDYVFVKDILRNKNVPLLSRNSVESVILHGKGNHAQTQAQRNKIMSDFRRNMPVKLQTLVDDPFIGDIIPEYFDGMTKHGALETVRRFYKMVIDKLQSEFETRSSDSSDYLSGLAYFMSKQPNYVWGFRQQGDNIEVSFLEKVQVIPKADLNYFQINSNTIRFNSTLVLTYLAFKFAHDYFNKEKRAKELTFLSELEYFTLIAVAELEYFTLIAGALVREQQIVAFVTSNLSHKVIQSYLFYFWLMTGKSFYRQPLYLHWPELDKSTSYFYNAARQAKHIFIKAPLDLQFATKCVFHSGTQSASITSDVVYMYEAGPAYRSGVVDGTTSIEDEVFSGAVDITSALMSTLSTIVILHRTHENQDNTVPILKDTEERIYLSKGNDDIIKFVLDIAQGINLKGSGRIKTASMTDKNAVDEQSSENLSYQIIDYKVVPSCPECEDEGIRIGSLAIDISSFQLRDSDISCFESAFANGLEVTEMRMADTGLNSDHVKRLCKSAITTNISHLVLTGNTLFTSNPEPGTGIGLDSLVTLEVLEMRDCRLGNVGFEAIQKDFLALKRLRCIDVSKNGITEPGLKMLCRSLQNSSGIRILRIHENDFGQNGGLIISLFIDRLENVEIMNLCYCGLGDQGIMALASVMKAKNIIKINLRGNGITTTGSLEFFKCFKECPRLNHIEYSQNEIGKLHLQTGIGVMPLVPDEPDPISGDAIDMLWSCQKSIEYMGLWECGIGNTTLLDGSKLFSGMTELTELILQTNELQNTHAATIGECLPTLKNLQNLVLRDNDIGPVGARKLTNGIARCPSLRTVMLDYNKINDFDVLTDIVEAATKALDKLEELDISFNVEMILIAKEDARYKRLLKIAQNSLQDPEVKEEQMKTEISSKATLIVI